MKAKAKKKRTVYVVAWADYIGSEHKDALGCGVFGETYSTMKAAHDAIMSNIRSIVKGFLDELACQSDEPYDKSGIDGIVADCVWRDEADSVRFEYHDIENAYEVQEIEV